VAFALREALRRSGATALSVSVGCWASPAGASAPADVGAASGSAAAAGAEHPDQAAIAEAVHHLMESTALELEAVWQGQDRKVGALRGGAEDHELGVAELWHGMIVTLR
jgi:hypothetical protein